jgi:hypothetical protein
MLKPMKDLMMAGLDRGINLTIAGIGLNVVILTLCGCSQEQNKLSSDDIHSDQANAQAISLRVKAFCADCHAYPQPDTFPKRSWAKEVASGFRFYDVSGRKDLVPPSFDEVVKYYEELAPEELTFSPNQGTAGNSPILFQQSDLNLSDDLPFPTVSFIHGVTRPDQANNVLWFCDMHSGRIEQIAADKQQSKILNTVRNSGFPAHVQTCDLDQDGHQDLLIADLGSFMPGDHQLGRVLWAKGSRDGQSYTVNVLAENLGRVADVRPIDSDGDGDLDLVVGEFGWRSTGRLLLLESVGGSGQPRYEQHILDERHGTSHVEPCDLNGDDLSDFVVLISQEFETVVGFINQGDGKFRKQKLFEAGDPSYGSTGIQVVDLDADNDLDILYSNGDMLDSGVLKPSHGVHLLENKGNLQFEAKRLTELPGAYKALAGDLDADGDLDVVACAFFFSPEFDASSLVWLEQQPDKSFVRHNLAGPDRQFCTLELGDFDGNGTVDIAVGNFDVKPSSNRAWLSYWWNLGTDDSK